MLSILVSKNVSKKKKKIIFWKLKEKKLKVAFGYTCQLYLLHLWIQIVNKTVYVYIYIYKGGF